MKQDLKYESRGQDFIRFVLIRLKDNKSVAAALRRADNASTEDQSWEYMAAFGVDLEKSSDRASFGLIAAAIAKAKISDDGAYGIGQAIAGCYKEGNRSDQAKAKLRRLLACDTTDEACAVLRPLLQLINAKSVRSLKFSRLLDDLLKFQWDSSKIKARWASDFYGNPIEKEGKS
ncbi:MAG: type I-E CRISPR-associated protein Cse2/CasB [Bdellovibrionales bacterium]|nr:type I-E CRISPR-associated protein Cse2/CasB [Bdellovibrionales bacterium]